MGAREPQQSRRAALREAIVRGDFPTSPDDEPTPIDVEVHGPIYETVRELRAQIRVMLGQIERIGRKVKWMTVATFAAMLLTLGALGGVAWLVTHRSVTIVFPQATP